MKKTDPNDILREHGPDALRRLFATALGLFGRGTDGRFAFDFRESFRGWNARGGAAPHVPARVASGC